MPWLSWNKTCTRAVLKFAGEPLICRSDRGPRFKVFTLPDLPYLANVHKRFEIKRSKKRKFCHSIGCYLDEAGDNFGFVQDLEPSHKLLSSFLGRKGSVAKPEETCHLYGHCVHLRCRHPWNLAMNMNLILHYRLRVLQFI